MRKTILALTTILMTTSGASAQYWGYGYGGGYYGGYGGGCGPGCAAGIAAGAGLLGGILGAALSQPRVVYVEPEPVYTEPAPVYAPSRVIVEQPASVVEERVIEQRVAPAVPLNPLRNRYLSPSRPNTRCPYGTDLQPQATYDAYGNYLGKRRICY